MIIQLLYSRDYHDVVLTLADPHEYALSDLTLEQDRTHLPDYCLTFTRKIRNITWNLP